MARSPHCSQEPYYNFRFSIENYLFFDGIAKGGRNGRMGTAIHPPREPSDRQKEDESIHLQRSQHGAPEGAAPDLGADDTESLSAEQLIRWALQRFGKDLCVSSSFGADSAVMLHLATQAVPGMKVLLVDTGYLFPETYRFAESLREQLGFELHVARATMTAAHQEALYGNLWEQGDEGVRRYLEINKVEPMKRALRELGIRAWMSGVRAQQTEHRRALPRVVLQDGCVKVHPILNWTRQQVDDYLDQHDLPRHPLVAQGYRSIGDWHSTIPVLEGEDERSGRLLGTKKECGLHLSDGERASFDSSQL